MFQNVLDPRSRPRLNEAAAWCAVGLVGAQLAVLGAAFAPPPQAATQPSASGPLEAGQICVELARALLVPGEEPPVSASRPRRFD